MSEKDKSQSKEMAELLAENPEAATYIAGVVQGMKLISNDTLKESSGHWEGGVRQSYGTSIYSTSKKLYVKVQDFGKKPKIGNPIQVDGMDLFIQNFDEQQGIYVITIDRKRQ